MKGIQSRPLNIALVLLGVAFTALGFGGFVEAVWKSGLWGLAKPNTIIMGGLFLGVGLWCGLGGWTNLRSARRGG